MSGALAIVHYDLYEERHSYLCRHGRTDRNVRTEGVGGTITAVKEMIDDHRGIFGCACTIEAMREWWVRKSDWLEAIRLDSLPENRAKLRRLYGAETAELAHQQNLRYLEMADSLDCATCQPGVEIYEDGHVEPIHSTTCPRSEQILERIDGARRAVTW